MRDLVRPARAWQLDIVVACRNLVCRPREFAQGLRDSPGQVEAEEARDDDATAEGDRQALDERDPAAAQLRRRLGHDERAEQVVAELERLRLREVALPQP